MSAMASPAPPLLTSLANPRVKAATALRDRRERDRTGLTLIDGAREVRRALAAGVEVVRLARQGDDDACRLLADLGTWLGVGIASFVNIFEPEHVVIGGGLSIAADLFLDAAISEAATRALPAGFEAVEISRAKGGPDAGVIGAGLLARNEYALARGDGDTARSPTFEGGV